MPPFPPPPPGYPPGPPFPPLPPGYGQYLDEPDDDDVDLGTYVPTALLLLVQLVMLGADFHVARGLRTGDKVSGGDAYGAPAPHMEAGKGPAV